MGAIVNMVAVCPSEFQTFHFVQPHSFSLVRRPVVRIETFALLVCHLATLHNSDHATQTSLSCSSSERRKSLYQKGRKNLWTTFVFLRTNERIDILQFCQKTVTNDQQTGKLKTHVIYSNVYQFKYQEP